MTDTPVRPLRALRGDIPRRHDRTCQWSWSEISPLEWNDVQRARCREWKEPCDLPEFTDGCPGCEDVIAWRQYLHRVTNRWIY